MGASVTKRLTYKPLWTGILKIRRGTTMSTVKAATRGGMRGCRHLQNDGNHRGRDPLGLSTSLEEEDDGNGNGNGNGTPAGMPDSTATVRRRQSSHMKPGQRRGGVGEGGGGEGGARRRMDLLRGGEGRGGEERGTTAIITTCPTSSGQQRGPCAG